MPRPANRGRPVTFGRGSSRRPPSASRAGPAALVLGLACIVGACGSTIVLSPAPPRSTGAAMSSSPLSPGATSQAPIAQAGSPEPQGPDGSRSSPGPSGPGPSSPGSGPGGGPTFRPSASPVPEGLSVPARPVLDITSALALQAAFAAAASRLGVPGAQATVLFADGQTWQDAYGWADVKARRPMTADDVFDVASVTKTFIAAEVIELAAAGRLSLDDPLSRWLPSFPKAASITVRELLSHTSGLADYLENPKLLRAIDADKARRWTAQELLAYVGPPLFSPGTDWRYSNTNYLLLGLVVEDVEGRSAAQVLADRFLDPLGLTDTALQTASDPTPLAARGPVAEPYARTGRTAAAVTALGDGSGYLPYASLGTALDSAGAMVSTSGDLARWGAALYGGQILAAPWLATMVDDSVSKRFHPARDYALGTERKLLAGLPTLGHSGACSGYRSALRYVPALGATVVVLVNEDVLDPDVITTRLIAALERSGWGASEAA